MSLICSYIYALKVLIKNSSLIKYQCVAKLLNRIAHTRAPPLAPNAGDE